MGRALKFVLGVIGLGFVFIVLVAMCSSPATKTHPQAAGTTTMAASASKTAEPAKPKLELIDAKVEVGEFGNRYVVGSVRNNTDRTYSYVQVEINLYDKSGAQVGSTLANVNNLEPGATWKFKAPVLEANAASFKVKEITGF